MPQLTAYHKNLPLFGFQNYKRHHHLLHGDTTMLECVFIVSYIFIGIVVIYKEITVVGEDIARCKAT